LKSSIRIHDCITTILKDQDEGKCAELKYRILDELGGAIGKAVQRENGGKIIVHVHPRRFHLYGKLEVFSKTQHGEYRLNLPLESRIVSDRNLSAREYSVTAESN
jgi:hypothetical protein